MEKERFVNEILNSVENTTKAIPREALFQKIEHRIQERFVSGKTLWLVAASIVILITLNIFFLNENLHSNTPETAHLEYTIHNNNQLYR